MQYPLTYTPGVVADDTLMARGGRYVDANWFRFVRADAAQPALPELCGGWERLTLTALSGVCRNAHAWIDNGGLLNIAFGTHEKLYVWRGGGLYDITPFGPPSRLGADPLTVADGSTTLTVAHAAHGYADGIEISLADAEPVGRQTPAGLYTIGVVDADSYTITLAAAADISKTLGTDPLAVANASPIVTVTEAGHTIADGTSVTIAGAASVGGITPNGTFPVSVIDEDTYQFTFSSNATATAAGGGSAVTASVPTTQGGAKVAVTPQTELPAGQVNGTGTAGYSTGGYGVGGYGQPSASDYFPRTWSFGNLGEALIVSPRGGAIYEWSNATDTRAQVIPEAPHQVTAILCTPERAIMALGCNEEVSDAFNPRCIRHSDLTDETVWTTSPSTTAREKVLEGAGRIVSARPLGPGELIFTDNDVWQAEYIGAVDETYRFTRQGEDCGLIGPNAAAVFDQQAFWLSPDMQFRTTQMGSEPQIVACPMREELKANLTPSQRDKIIASSLSRFGEVWFFYPDVRDGLEVSRALFVNAVDGWWSKGQVGRTAFIDAGPADYPVGVDEGGAIYWHERGQTADGGRITGHLEAGPQYVDAGRQALFLRAFWPDASSQVGAANLTIKTREYPQSADVSYGPLSMAPDTEMVPLRIDGRILSWRMDIDAGPAGIRVGTPIAEGKPTRRAK